MWQINATKYFHAIFKKSYCGSVSQEKRKENFMIFQPCGLFLPETVSLCGTRCWLMTDFGADCMFVKTMNSIYRSHARDSEKFSIFKHIFHIRLLEWFFSRCTHTETFKSTYLLIGNFLSFLCFFCLVWGLFFFFETWLSLNCQKSQNQLAIRSRLETCHSLLSPDGAASWVPLL